MTAMSALMILIAKHGPIQSVRVSSAQARGAAKQYSYWGAVRYQIGLSRSGAPINVAQGRASSDRRSYRLAQQDAEALAAAIGGVCCDAIGGLTDADAAGVIDQLMERGPLAAEATAEVARQVAGVRATPNWMERAAAREDPWVPLHWLTTEERTEAETRRERVEALRAARKAQRSSATAAERTVVRHIWWRGAIPLTQVGTRLRDGRAQVRYVAGHYSGDRQTLCRWYGAHRAARSAATQWLKKNPRRVSGMTLRRDGRGQGWTLIHPATYASYGYSRRPRRADLVAATIALPREPQLSHQPGPRAA